MTINKEVLMDDCNNIEKYLRHIQSYINMIKEDITTDRRITEKSVYNQTINMSYALADMRKLVERLNTETNI
jgi:hypothetical protein